MTSNRHQNKSSSNQEPEKVWSSKASGFTLIEIMVALALGATLLSGMISVFLGHKRTSGLNEAVIEMQQSARFALSVLARDIRMAGFQGCSDPMTGTSNIIADTSPTTDLAATAISGHVITTTGDLEPQGPIGFSLPDVQPQPIEGSHALVVQFGSPETHQLEPMTNANEPVVLTTDSPGFVTGDLVLISNCQVSDIFQVSGAQLSVLQHDSSVNSNESELSAAYGSAGENNRPRAMRFESNVYFLADSGRTNGAGDSITSLYRQSLPYVSQPLEVIEGVENLQLRFTLSGENGNVRYVTADELEDGDAANILSVQIGLLMRSHDRVSDTSPSANYKLAGEFVSVEIPNTGNRHRMRMAFNSTIRVRNRR